MPRTPAPLTVEYWKDYDFWAVNRDGIIIARCGLEADARAFVALPTLITAVKRICDPLVGAQVYIGYPIMDALRAALAQADGPAPTEKA